MFQAWCVSAKHVVGHPMQKHKTPSGRPYRHFLRTAKIAHHAPNSNMQRHQAFSKHDTAIHCSEPPGKQETQTHTQYIPFSIAGLLGVCSVLGWCIGVEGAYLGHGAPHLSALHIGDVACPGQVKPVGLVQLGADQEVEVGDALVLTHQRGRQAQLAVSLHNANYLPPCQDCVCHVKAKLHTAAWTLEQCLRASVSRLMQSFSQQLVRAVPWVAH